MSIEQTNIVDIVAFDEDSGYMVLTITDHVSWDSHSSEHLLLLQDKLNAYLRFIESGELLDTHPKAKGRPVKIVLMMKNEPTPQALIFFNEASAIMKRAAVEFEFQVFRKPQTSDDDP